MYGLLGIVVSLSEITLFKNSGFKTWFKSHKDEIISKSLIDKGLFQAFGSLLIFLKQNHILPAVLQPIFSVF